MKKVMRSLVATAIIIIAMTACTGNKLDTERIMQYAQEQKEELSESDYDFFIDQMEIISDMTKDMDMEKANEFYRNLPEEKRQAIVVVNLVLMSSDNKLTDAQKERLKTLSN